jgi:translation initiation factor 4E
MDSSSNMSQMEEVEHKLTNGWVFWVHFPQDTDWTPKSYKNICRIDTVEQVISIIHLLPEDLVKNCMLFIMKQGINPTWEDPQNRNGGCFSYKITNKYVYEVWKKLTYLLVGDTISTNQAFNNSITGITISPKKNFCIIKIWMTDCNHQNPAIVSNDVKGLSSQGCIFKKHTPEY